MKDEEKLPKVMVANPMEGTTVTHNCYRGMLTLARTYKGELTFEIAQGLSVQWSRELLADKFLKSDCEYLFFVDTDIGVPAGSLEKLLSHKKGIITGLAFNRHAPFFPRIYKKFDPKDESKGFISILDYPEGLVEVDACGGDVLLIHRSVLEKLPKPWFTHPKIDHTEDIQFCRNAFKEGFQTYADTRVKTLHDTSMTVNEALFKGNLPQQ